MADKISVLGAGLAGCEAAWQAAEQGVKVKLYEMKPKRFSPAHHSENFAELVCSNSLRSDDMSNAVGLLKNEMRILSSLIISAAEATAVPAGSALAVDREGFSHYVTDKIKNHPDIEIINEEVSEINDDEITVVATGPLTSDGFADYLSARFGSQLHFFDAAAPIVEFDSIDMSVAFFASRYDKGEASYINCPMNKEQYDRFYDALINAREAELHDFDKEQQNAPNVFEGCMPIEVMARRGYDTMRFGPLKPVGLPLPSTGEEAYAVVQLRQDNVGKTNYNIVGFQTHLAFPEQKRVFGMIPGLENAVFSRYGVMHRNTYLNSPALLNPDYSLRENGKVFFAGQMNGVEGYVESAASGIACGINAARLAAGKEKIIFPRSTVIGSMAYYVSTADSKSFQPMNANFGLLEPLSEKVKGGKRAVRETLAKRALEKITEINDKRFSR